MCIQKALFEDLIFKQLTFPLGVGLCWPTKQSVNWVGCIYFFLSALTSLLEWGKSCLSTTHHTAVFVLFFNLLDDNAQFAFPKVRPVLFTQGNKVIPGMRIVTILKQ